MWYTVRRISVLALLIVAVSAAAASAQYNAPATPSTPAAPSTPSPAPATVVPAAPGTYEYAVNVAFAGDNRVILTDANGMTLYYLKNETLSAPICTGNCTAVWPPVVAGAAGTATVTVDPALSPVYVITTANGTQISYHGHRLYRYSKDTAPGQLNGDRVVDTWGTWAVATPDLAYWP